MYDNFFETVRSTDQEQPEGWEQLVTYSSEHANLEDPDPDDPNSSIPGLNDEWLNDQEMAARHQSRMRGRREADLREQDKIHNLK